MRCVRCRAKPEIYLRAHNAAFCRPCFLLFFRRRVERTIEQDRMFAPGDRLLVAVSGGKDSLALWDVLLELGHDTIGLYVAQDIGAYSARSQNCVEAFAQARGAALHVVDLAREHAGLGVPTVAALTNRAPCAACGKLKRHYFDAAAAQLGVDVLVTGHNLDDEAARLLGNVLRWSRDHLARQRPVLEPSHPRLVRKVRPLYLTTEYETAAYAFMRGIDYVVDECPNAAGATQLVYKDALDRLEAASPGTKLGFVQGFARHGRAAFETPVTGDAPATCESCGMPSYASRCAFCALVAEVERKRARQAVTSA
jgi:tRNA-5-methyluridine54 2-sulfurtransferase